MLLPKFWQQHKIKEQHMSFSNVAAVLTRGYSQEPSTVQKIGRGVLIAMNVAGAVGPLLAALSGASKSTWLEVLSDSSVHTVAVITLLSKNTPTWPSVVVNAFRAFTLFKGFSTFPAPAPSLDAIVHSANVISPYVL